MPSPKSKKGSPNKSPDKSKGSKKDGKDSKSDLPPEEDELIVPVPEGIMHRRMRFLFESQLKTDVEFLVGPEDSVISLKAHKCMLAAESPIFEKLFAECEEWKVSDIKKREEEARKKREEAREMELAIQNASLPKSKSPDKSEKKGSPGKAGKSPDKKSPKEASGKNSPPKSSPQKKSKSKEKEKSPQKSGSPKAGKKPSHASGGGSGSHSEQQPNYYKDEVIGSDIIRIRDVQGLGLYRLFR